MSAPFCTSSSATGNAVTLPGVGERVELDGEAEAGEAGSAAASARKTACVLRDRSAAFVFAPRAIAYKTPWISFFLMLARRVSSAVE